MQADSAVTNCFLKGQYKYYAGKKIEVYKLEQFLSFFKSLPEHKKKIVLANLWQRFDSFAEYQALDDLPF